MNHPVIIGAGGVASYLLPVLLKTFKPAKVTIVDKDTLELRNLDRQMFDPEDVGKNKANALVMAQRAPQTGFFTLDDWFTDSTTLPDDVDAIICCADNHMARHAAILRAQDLDCYAYIGGNEYLDSQAFVAHSKWRGTPKDPLVRYPNIATDHSGSPVRCQGDAQIASPQLAIANLACAAKLLHLIWIYEVWLRENPLPQNLQDNLPTELFTSLSENSCL